MYAKLVTAVRLLMGFAYFVSGFNWWIKLITPYPSISDFTAQPPPPDMVGAMIQTGFMFHIVKATELLAGLALLSNRFVPLMLVVVFPVTVSICLFDVFIVAKLRGVIMGGGAFVMNAFLLFAYLDSYAPMLKLNTTPAPWHDTQNDAIHGWNNSEEYRLFRLALAIVALAFAVAVVTWLVVLIVQYALHPQPLKIPRAVGPGA
ncbi:MAG: hypothetical protein AB7T07_13920 [Steroidobacteraceae bacterium]